MKIKFKVHHKYGLAYEEVFSLEQLGLGETPIEELKKDNEKTRNHIRPLLHAWVMNHYNYEDALPSWEIMN